MDNSVDTDLYIQKLEEKKSRRKVGDKQFFSQINGVYDRNQNIWIMKEFISVSQLVRNDMDVNEHERLSNVTLRHKLKKRDSTFIAILHFTVTLGSSTIA